MLSGTNYILSPRDRATPAPYPLIHKKNNRALDSVRPGNLTYCCSHLVSSRTSHEMSYCFSWKETNKRQAAVADLEAQTVIFEAWKGGRKGGDIILLLLFPIC